MAFLRQHQETTHQIHKRPEELTSHRRGLLSLSQSTSEALYIPERANQTNRCKV